MGKTCFLIFIRLHYIIAYQAKILELLTWMNAYFLVMEWNFCWSRIWMSLAVIIFLISSTWSIYYLRNFLCFLQATTGDWNPNFQVVITHALQLYAASIRLDFPYEWMESTERNLITSVWTFYHLDHTYFDHLSRESCANHRVIGAKVFWPSIVVTHTP